MPRSTNRDQAKPRIFISYARDDDKDFAMRLWRNLEAHGFDVWWDREAMESRGLSFLREIRDAISGVDRVLLIIGPRVKNSHYVEAEWRHALRAGVVVTPLLRLGDYQDVPEVLHPLHCEDVRSSISEQEALKKVRRIVSTPVPPLGPLSGVPRLPTPFLERSDRLDHLRSRVLIDSYKPIDFQPDQRITSLTGMGGVGKSVLATALAQAPDVRRSFQDGIFWIPVGREASTLRILSHIGLAIGDGAVDRYTGVPEARLLLSKALATKNCLIVLDDVWAVEVAEALHTAAGTNVRILLTSRKSKLFASAGVHEVPVDELSKDEALDLLSGWTEVPLGELPSEALKIADACGNLPLALAMIGATIRGRPERWRQALERLRRADLSKIQRKLPDYQYETLDRAMLVSFEDLDEDRKRRYLDLVVVPEDAAAPAAMVLRWWTHEGIDELTVTDVLDDLVDRSLLRVDEHEAYMLHDVQRDFLVMRTDDERSLHARWLAAFEPKPSGDWAAADGDSYLFTNLGHHLRGADREDEWRKLLVSFSWLERKTEFCGSQTVLLDLAQYSMDDVIGPLHRVCRRAAHILTNDPAQLAAQLLARIDPTTALEGLLEGARAWRRGPWLRPTGPSLREGDERTLAVFRGREEDGHAGTPRTIAFSADCRLIASGGGSSNDLTMKVWSASAGILLRTYENALEAGGTMALAFVASEDRVAAATGEEVRLYAFDAEKPIACHAFGDSIITCICGGGLSDSVFVGFEDGRVLAWDPASDTVVDLRKSDGEAVIALEHASSTSRLAIATASAVECRETKDSQLVGRLEESAGYGRFHFQAAALAIAPDGLQVFFGDRARVWVVSEPRAELLMEAIDVNEVVAFSEDGAVALAAPNDREIAAFDTASGQCLRRIRNSREFSCMAIAPDGKMIVTGDYEHDVKLWDLTGIEARAFSEERPEYTAVAICDDQTVAMVTTDDVARLYDIDARGLFDKQGETIPANVVRRSQSLLDPGLRGELRARLEAVLGVTKDEMSFISEVPVGVLAFSEKASRAVSAPGYMAKFADIEERPYSKDHGGDYPLQLWDLANIGQPQHLCGHTMPITCADLTADGTHALTGSWGRVLRLWDLDAGECRQVLRGHRGILFACALTDDARLAVSGSEDMTIRLWDLKQGKLLFTFATSSAVSMCDISRDGSVAVAHEVSGRVHVYSVSGLPGMK